MKKTVSVQERVAELVCEHGSYRAASAATGISLGYLNAIGTARKAAENCTVGTIEKLGLTAVFYRRTNRDAGRK